MEIWRLILDYLAVLMTWPVAVLVIAVVFMSKFTKQIGNLIKRLKTVEITSRGIKASSRSQRDEKPVDDRPVPEDAPGEEPAVEQGPLNEAQVEVIRDWMGSQQRLAAHWEYMYLNRYLVRNTQMLLDSIISLQQPASLQELDSKLMEFVIDANERTAMFGALATHHLIELPREQLKTGMVTVTPKGREYGNWRGALPPLTDDSSA